MAFPPLLQPKPLEKLCRNWPARVGSRAAALCPSHLCHALRNQRTASAITSATPGSGYKKHKGKRISGWKALIYRDPMTPSVAVKIFERKKEYKKIFIKDIHSRELSNTEKGERQLRKWQAKLTLICYSNRIIIIEQYCPTLPCFPSTCHHPPPKMWFLSDANKYQKLNHLDTRYCLVKKEGTA